jgi:hypothetical protein
MDAWGALGNKKKKRGNTNLALSIHKKLKNREGGIEKVKLGGARENAGS